MNEGFRTVYRRRLSGTQPAVDLEKRLFIGLARVFIQRGNDPGVLSKQINDLCVRMQAEGTDQAGDGKLAVFVDADIKQIGRVGLILQPCSTVRDDRRSVDLRVGLRLHGPVVVDARAPDDLDTMTRSAPLMINVPAVVIRGKSPHEDLLFFDLFGLLIAKAPRALSKERRRFASLALHSSTEYLGNSSIL